MAAAGKLESSPGGLTVRLPSGYPQERWRRYQGRDPQSLSERFEGRDFALALSLLAEDGSENRPALVRGTLDSSVPCCRFQLPPDLAPEQSSQIRAQMHRLLGLSLDPAPFERQALRSGHRRLVKGREGLRIFQTRDFFEGLVWVIAGQQVSVAAAAAMRRRLTRAVGRPVGEGLVAPPEPGAVASMEPEELRPLGFSRSKAKYLVEVARDIVGGQLDLDELQQQDVHQQEQRLLSVRGLGPWSVAYLLMRCCGSADCVPVGDVALARALQNYFSLPSRPRGQEMAELLAPFAPYRSFATFHLWASLEVQA